LIINNLQKSKYQWQRYSFIESQAYPYLCIEGQRIIKSSILAFLPHKKMGSYKDAKYIKE